MFVDWNEINKGLSPLKDFEDMAGRFRKAFAYPFVCENFNFTLPALTDYTERLLGGDSKGRYTEYLARLTQTMDELQHAGIGDIRQLAALSERRDMLASFAEENQIYAHEIVRVLKFMVYWLIPGEKYLSGLIRDDPLASAAIKTLAGIGVRTNLEILERGRTPAGRKDLAEASGLPEATIAELVNRADFSRMPWASKATISNIMGAGYCSLAELAGADPEKLYSDFFGYGKAIGKNLKLGNEIENSYRIAKIVPAVVR